MCGSKTISDELERDEDKRGADLINRLATDSSMRFIRARQHTTDVVLGYRSVRNDFIRGDGFMFSVIRSSPIRFAYFLFLILFDIFGFCLYIQPSKWNGASSDRIGILIFLVYISPIVLSDYIIITRQIKG